MDLRNFRTARKLLQHYGLYELPERITAVYTALRDSPQAGPVSRRGDDDIVFAAIFVMRSGYSFEKGLVEVMRVHLSDSWGYMRSAIEAAGFVDLVRRDHALARTWLGAGTDEAQYELYRKRFRMARLFPEADPLMRKLRAMYDWASRMASHGSPYSFSMRLLVAQQGTAQQIRFGYQDVKRPGDIPGDVLTMFMVHINTHLTILQVFARALKDVIEKATWDLYFNTAEGLFDDGRRRLERVQNPRQRRVAGLVVPASLITPVRARLWTPAPVRPAR